MDSALEFVFRKHSKPLQPDNQLKITWQSTLVNWCEKTCSVALSDGEISQERFNQRSKIVSPRKLPDCLVIVADNSGGKPLTERRTTEMFPQILASDQKILKITNLNNSKPAYQPPIVFKGIIQPFCLSYIFSTFMRTDSCSNNFRAETTKLSHKMRSAKNSVQHATWKASHPTQVGRKWRNGNVIYLKFCLVIRDLLKKKLCIPSF